MAYHGIVTGQDSQGRPLVSVMLTMCHAVSPEGTCTWQGEETEIVTEPILYKDMAPDLLQRDLDLYAWRSKTDVVVQGTVRSDKPVGAMPVQLSCEGEHLAFDLGLVVSGDRHVERRSRGLRVTDPLPFTEMPLRYDKAYGGRDELAGQRRGAHRAMRFLEEQFGEGAGQRAALFGYPRNPAGKGYLIEADAAEGLAWPNVEFPDDRLSLASLTADHLSWGERPFPAGFDWFPHDWFPRLGLMGLFPQTRDNRPPKREVDLGILDPDVMERPLLQRQRHEVAQGAHPYLWRHRLQGDEKIQVTAMSRDGRDFVVQLTPHHPRVFIKQFSDPEEEAPVVLDCVFVETDLDRVTMVWRGTLPARRLGVPRGWEEFCDHRVQW